MLLTDRFNNADPANDHADGRKDDAATRRGFMRGDLTGVTAKIRRSHFTEPGVGAIWIRPPVQQIHGATDEGTAISYGFHGYWARYFTAIDADLPDIRTESDAPVALPPAPVTKWKREGR